MVRTLVVLLAVNAIFGSLGQIQSNRSVKRTPADLKTNFKIKVPMEAKEPPDAKSKEPESKFSGGKKASATNPADPRPEYYEEVVPVKVKVHKVGSNMTVELVNVDEDETGGEKRQEAKRGGRGDARPEEEEEDDLLQHGCARNWRETGEPSREPCELEVYPIVRHDPATELPAYRGFLNYLFADFFPVERVKESEEFEELIRRLSTPPVGDRVPITEVAALKVVFEGELEQQLYECVNCRYPVVGAVLEPAKDSSMLRIFGTKRERRRSVRYVLRVEPLWRLIDESPLSKNKRDEVTFAFAEPVSGRGVAIRVRRKLGSPTVRSVEYKLLAIRPVASEKRFIENMVRNTTGNDAAYMRDKDFDEESDLELSYGILNDTRHVLVNGKALKIVDVGKEKFEEAPRVVAILMHSVSGVVRAIPLENGPFSVRLTVIVSEMS